MRLALVSLAALSLAACSGSPANNVATANGANAAAPAPADNASNNVAAAANIAAEPVIRTETVVATFTGWEMGDYLWGQFTAPGREPFSAQPGPSPVDLFLDANRGREVTVEVATVMANIPEAGPSPTEIQRITAARNADGTAEQWYAGLSAADRAAAQRRFEEGALSSGAR